MNGLEQFMQEPGTMVLVLIAGAVGAMLVCLWRCF